MGVCACWKDYDRHNLSPLPDVEHTDDLLEPRERAKIVPFGGSPGDKHERNGALMTTTQSQRQLLLQGLRELICLETSLWDICSDIDGMFAGECNSLDSDENESGVCRQGPGRGGPPCNLSGDDSCWSCQPMTINAPFVLLQSTSPTSQRSGPRGR
jgi:hypothetical protein